MSDQERKEFEEQFAIPRGWRNFTRSEDGYYEADEGRLEAMWKAWQAGRAALAQQAVPDIDYDKLIKDCYRITKQAKGTKGCVCFKLGAEWFREQVLAAAPAAPQAMPEGHVAVTVDLIRRAQQAINWHLEPNSPDEHEKTMLELSAIGWPDLADATAAMLAAAPAAPQASQAPAVGALPKLLAHHAALLEQSEYTYFELAYTRQTGWMAWITDKPGFKTVCVNPDRKVIAKGQGSTPEEAAADALAGMGESDVPVQPNGEAQAAPQAEQQETDWVRFWLRAALNCKGFEWDADQREMAEAALAAQQAEREPLIGGEHAEVIRQKLRTLDTAMGGDGESALSEVIDAAIRYLSLNSTGQQAGATLSSRLRPGVECAPWVAAEVQKLEARLAAQQAAPQAEQQAKPAGYMNAGQLLELGRGGAPYGYVYPEEGPGASIPVYATLAAQQAVPLSKQYLRESVDKQMVGVRAALAAQQAEREPPKCDGCDGSGSYGYHSCMACNGTGKEGA